MKRLKAVWTWERINNEIPRETGISVHLINNDIVEDTGENWLVTRGGETHYFEEKKMLVDFIFMNTPSIADVLYY